MKVQTFILFFLCILMVGCVMTPKVCDYEVENNLSIKFAMALREEIARVWSDFSWSVLTVSEQGDWSTYEFQIRDYLMRTSPRSQRYITYWSVLEHSFRKAPIIVRQYDSGFVHDNIVIEHKQKWYKSFEDRRSSTINAVFGPIYTVDELGEIITTMRFIVDSDHIMAYVWIAIFKRDDKGEWVLIEMACVSSYKNWTVFVNEAYVE